MRAVAIISLVTSCAASMAAAEDMEVKTMLWLMSDGTAALAAGAACDIDMSRVSWLAKAQEQLIRQGAQSVGNKNPDTLIKIRDDAFRKMKAEIDPSICEGGVQKFELFENAMRDRGLRK